MIPPWVERYVGIPYADAQGGNSGADCYHLIRMVYAEVYGVDLDIWAGLYDASTPYRARAEVIAQAKQADPWYEVVAPYKVGDVLILRASGLPVHCAMVVDPAGAFMLHTTAHAGTSRVEHYQGAVWSRRLEYAVRHPLVGGPEPGN